MLNNQDSKCFICIKEITFDEARIDHDHKTGKIRKILCNHCNLVLGLMKDDIKLFKNIIKYLKENE